MLVPNWYYALVPPGWWPERPREFFVYTLNVVPLPAAATPFGSDAQRVNTTQEVVFSKRADTLVIGGCALVTTTNGFTVIEGAEEGTGSQILAKLYDPATDSVYTVTSAVVTPGGVASDERGARNLGFVALENLLAAGKGQPGQRPAIWPIPIAVRRGASLVMQFVNLNGGAARHLRISFWCATLPDKP